jgi:dTMP kinase
VFICFEGIDGAGKSTQARMLYEHLTADGIDVELVADPGTTRIGQAIREILLANDAPISPSAQMLLFSAARAELAEYIKTKLAANTVILCDRWLLSTLVYQGELNKIPTELILQIFRGTSDLLPDLYFVLDISPEEARVRMGAPGDRYERRCLRDRQKMRDAYLDHAKNLDSSTVHVIPAHLPPDDTHAQIYNVFQRVCR